MLKAIFGLLGLAVVLAIVGSLAKNQLGAIGQIGQAAARVLGPAGRTAGGAAPVGLAATAGAPMPPTQPRARDVQKSVFERQDDALQQSEQRYRRAEP
jgi:hypothetical protein